MGASQGRVPSAAKGITARARRSATGRAPPGRFLVAIDGASLFELRALASASNRALVGTIRDRDSSQKSWGRHPLEVAASPPYGPRHVACDTSSMVDVLVLGAGAAGLVAAVALDRAGLSVKVLDGRSDCSAAGQRHRGRRPRQRRAGGARGSCGHLAARDPH